MVNPQQPVVYQQPVMAQPIVIQQPVYQQPGMVNNQMAMNNGGGNNEEMEKMKKQLAAMHKKVEETKKETEKKKLKDILNSDLEKVAIKQDFDMLEAIVGRDLPDKYSVYKLDDEGQITGRKLITFEQRFTCKEKATPTECQGCSFKVITKSYNAKDDEVAAKLNVPCVCKCCCMGERKVEIMLTEDGQQIYCGNVQQKKDCCNHLFEVQDEENQPAFRMMASKMQCIFFCSDWPCEACQQCEIEIKPVKNSFTVGKAKYIAGKCCEDIGELNVNYFQVTFPKNMTHLNKLTFLTGILLIYSSLFKKGQRGKTQQQMGRRR